MTDIMRTGIPGWIDNDDQEWPRFVHAFAYYDPLSGSVPDPFANEFAEIAMRARTIVANWDADTLIRAADFLDWLLEQTPTNRQVDLEPREIYTMERPESTARAFIEHWAHLDVQHWIDVAAGAPAPTEQRLFATLALATIGNWCYELHQRNATAGMSDGLRSLRAGQCAIQAMEALCYAEQFMSATTPVTPDTTQKKLSEAGKKGGLAKHAKTNAVRRKLEQRHEQGDFEGLSGYRVARVFPLQLSPEERALFKDPDKTFADWIYQLRHPPAT